MNLGFVMKSVFKSKTNKYKCTDIFLTLLPKPLFICACAMPRAKTGQQKVPILKRTTGIYPSRSYYSMLCTYITTWHPGEDYVTAWSCTV